MAGLPGSNPIVSVGPPLLCSGPSSGSKLFKSPVLVKLHVPSLLTLCPCETIGPAQFPPEELLATMLFCIVTCQFPGVYSKIPPPYAGNVARGDTALLQLNVLLLMVAGPTRSEASC